MNDEAVRQILSGPRTIAIVGAKDNPGRPVDRVGRYLIEVGYNVVPVHPVRRSVWGIASVPSLIEIGEPVHIVDVFRAPEFCLEHACEAAQLSPKPLLFWMQSGIENNDARELLEEQGVNVVQNACLMMEHLRLFG